MWFTSSRSGAGHRRDHDPADVDGAPERGRRGATGDLFWGFPETSVEAAMPLSQAEIRKTKGGRELHFEVGAIPCRLAVRGGGWGRAADESEI